MKENKNFIKGSHKEGCNYKYYKKGIGAVYKIIDDETGHFYIGRTSDVGRRLSHHFAFLRKNTHKCFRLQELYNLSSYENFSFEVIEMPDFEERIRMESKLLLENKNNRLLLNTTNEKGVWAEERNPELTSNWKNKISELAKERTGERNPFYDKKHSIETKSHLSKIRLGSKNSACYRSIVINGVIYESVTAASQSIKVPMATIVHRAKSQKRLFSNWYYYDDCSDVIDKELLFSPEQKPTGLYFVCGTKYFDIKDIMDDFDIKHSTMSFRFNSKNFPEWIKVL